MLSPRAEVRILEVAARDGLQNIKATIPTATKIALLQKLAATGLKHIEATSFVSPKWVPQLADGDTVLKSVLPLAAAQGIIFPVLAPNMKGLENACKAGAQEVEVFASATEAFSKANQNCSIEEALRGAELVAAEAKKRGVRVRGVISCIFSDPYSGPTDPSSVLRVAKRFVEMGCYEVGLGDTLGVGTPVKTQRLLETLLREIPADKLAGHFHDTYGQGVANVVAAYSMGIRAFDSAVAGLGGCPYAKGAKGNVATEDVVYTLEESGISTGVDLDKLINTGQWISEEIGIPYGSRAGAALLAKRSPTSKPAEKTKTKREWTTVSDEKDYRVSRAGPVVKVTLTRPQHGNTMTVSMLDGLTEVFTKLSKDRSAFHVVLDAEGRFFCTGMDLSGGTKTTDTDKDHGYHAKINALFAAIDNCPQTTIALINGPCYGGGVGLGFACDVRLASTKARWTLSEVKIGVAPAIISRYMAREWGMAFFREAMLSGREVHHSELQRIGAVHGVADDTEDLLNGYLDTLERCAPRAASVCKELVRLAWRDAGGSRQDDFIEGTFHNMMVPGSEGEHGIQQFQKKNRRIDWEGFWAQKATVAT
ncbi:aldolase [Aspergillus unguis]